MVRRDKRSVSIPPELASAIDMAAAAAGTTFSAWLSTAADHRLRIEAGRRAVAAWELEQGQLTPAELADGARRAGRLLGRRAPPRA